MPEYIELDVWKSSLALVKSVYQITRCYPKDEVFGLISQTKRAAVSISSNIAEGLGRSHKKETLHFLSISKGSGYELQTHFIIGSELEFLSQTNFEELEKQRARTMQLLNGFIRHIISKME